MIRIAIYGKGGIGKSTTASNISAALAAMGRRVMQIGCDPKSDSTTLLMGGKRIPTVLDILREGREPRLSDLVFESESGVLCAEAGGPTPGIGCAGRGIITAFQQLQSLGAFDTLHPDVVIYDVLGDVVCGGFAMPLRGDYSDFVLVVTSGEKMSLFAAENIVTAVRNFKSRGYASFAGFIQNSRSIPRENELVDELAKKTGAGVLARIPRSSLIQSAEDEGKTVVELFPESDLAKIYREIALKILELKKP